MSEIDVMLAKARAPRSDESVDAEAKYKKSRGVQINALRDLLKTVEWTMFEKMVNEDELDKWEAKVLDPTALETGSVMAEAMVPGPDGKPVRQKMPAPIEGQSLAMQMCWRLGVAWGIRNTLTYPGRAIKGYARMMESQRAQQKLLDASGKRAPISGINKNPVEGGS